MRQVIGRMADLARGWARLLREWIGNYNRERLHTSLGSGFPERPPDVPPPKPVGHRLPARHRVVATPILGGLHHEYRIERVGA
jgi:hypothetical protein